MLGKGLSSLIPPRDNSGQNDIRTEEQRNRGMEERFGREQSVPPPALPEVLEIEQAEIHSIPSEGGESVSSEDEFPRGEATPSSDDELRRGEAVFHIEVEKIHPNPYQPRREFDEEKLQELAHSIREYGIIQPLVVSRIRKEGERGAEVRYQIVAGERRYRAACKLGLPTVPVVIRVAETPKGNLEVALVENLQRSDLNPLETARAYSRLQEEFGLTQREVATRVGKSRESVANTLRLLSLPSYVQDALQGGKINESQARALLAIPDMERQKQAFEQLVSGRLSARGLRERVKGAKNDPEQSFYEKQLEERVGAPVEISKRGEKGKVVIRFFSDDELQGVLQRLLGEME